MDGVGIHIAPDLAGDVGFGGQADRLRGEGGVAGEKVKHACDGLRKAVVHNRQAARANRGDRGRQQARRIGLDRLPAIEEIAVACGQDQEIFRRGIQLQFHRRRETAQHRGHRAFGDILKHDAAGGCAQFENTVGAFLRTCAAILPLRLGAEGEIAARPHKAKRYRENEGLLLRLPRRRRS